jgi:hypothetical protein
VRVKLRIGVATGIVLLTLAVFGDVRDHTFVNFDDYPYIVTNPNLPDGFNAETVLRAFTTPYFANWHPLTSITYQLDYALYGADATGYLVTNVVLHALAAVLLFLALARMTGALWRSAFVAAVLAVHPLHVESVAWVSERKDVHSGLFWG